MLSAVEIGIMLIRSQDKEILINPHNVSQLYRVGFCITVDFADNRDSGFRDIGNYSSKEKAIKVLDMIQEFYDKYMAFSMGEDRCYHEASEKKTFKMPQDEEVEV